MSERERHSQFSYCVFWTFGTVAILSCLLRRWVGLVAMIGLIVVAVKVLRHAPAWHNITLKKLTGICWGVMLLVTIFGNSSDPVLKELERLAKAEMEQRESQRIEQEQRIAEEQAKQEAEREKDPEYLAKKIVYLALLNNYENDWDLVEPLINVCNFVDNNTKLVIKYDKHKGRAIETTKLSIVADLGNIFKDTFKHPNLASVQKVSVDVYGVVPNTSGGDMDIVMAQAEFSRELFNKINWDIFDYGNLKSILEEDGRFAYNQMIADNEGPQRWLDVRLLGDDVTIGEWEKATFAKKLCTCGDWLTAAKWEGRLNSSMDFEKLKVKASILVKVLDETFNASSDEMDEMMVMEYAIGHLSATNDLGPDFNLNHITLFAT